MRSLLHHPLQRAAAGRSGLILALAWGVAEALWWPIVPDFPVLALVPLAPRRWWKLAAAASFGSVAGGAFGYWLAGVVDSDTMMSAAPLITSRMAETAREWLGSGGVAAILRQPLSGIPYKVFVFISRDLKLDFAGFVLFSVLARGVRIMAAGGVGAIVGHRVIGNPRLSRYYDVFFALLTIAFAIGLWRVVAWYS